MTYKQTDGKNVELNVSALDDHELAKLEKQFKRRGTDRKQIGSSSIGGLDLSLIEGQDLARLEKHFRIELNERRRSPGKIDAGKVQEDEWRDIIEIPDLLRHPNQQENKGGSIDYPFTPADYYRHARIALRKKIAKSKQDRKEVLDEFFATAVSDNMIVLQCMRLHLDKMCIQPPENRFQDSFTVNFGTINAVKEKKEKHVMALFESMSRIENIPISINQVGQLNVAGANQQVNNDLHKSPDATTKEKHVSGSQEDLRQ